MEIANISQNQNQALAYRPADTGRLALLAHSNGDTWRLCVRSTARLVDCLGEFMATQAYRQRARVT